MTCWRVGASAFEYSLWNLELASVVGATPTLSCCMPCHKSQPWLASCGIEPQLAGGLWIVATHPRVGICVRVYVEMHTHIYTNIEY